MNKLWQAALFLLILLLAACGSSSSDKEEAETDSPETNAYPSEIEENPIVTITMENDEQIIIELYPETAPNTVANFISLAKEGFYDGLIFHRVIPGFMIQGGDPSGDGTGGADYTIRGEFSSNGFDNGLEHDRGVISMARAHAPDSASSQFFIMTDKSPHLDGEYAAFGKVAEGMETVDKIVSAERDSMDKPLEDHVMKKVEVDENGYDYPEPETQN